MERLVKEFVREEKTKFPAGPCKKFSYGTAGFRDKAELLDCVFFRSAIIASLRSKCTRAAIGIVITASHNPEQDNGVKFVDTQGQMLIPEWEHVASSIANADSENLYDIAMSFVAQYDLDNEYKPVVLIGRDTRPSGDLLLSILIEGLNLLQSSYIDNEYVTTPQLHYIVKSYNFRDYGEPTLTGYYQKLSKAFKQLMPPSTQEHKPVMKLDAANGVGAGRVKDLLDYIGDVMSIEIYNDGTIGKLNHMCGADYVKRTQLAPNGIPISVGDCCVSFDGDADRIVFFYVNKDGEFVLLDGDKIACLIAMFVQDLLNKLQLKLSISVIQTAYSNGNSTNYIKEKLKINATCVKTGVKYLQRKANEFDVGIFFEANGHGTVLYSNNAVQSIKEIINSDQSSPDIKDCGRTLLSFIDLTNQTTGDAISDLMIVQAILSNKKWTCDDWGHIYTDLPNRQLQIKVKDRHVITTSEDETQCITPAGLQDAINELVSSVPCGRSFVRASGTEDVVRVYAEAETKELADTLARSVGNKVYEMAAGVGDRP